MIIRSLLENDVYKWNMSYAIMKTYPFAETVFKFKDRKNEVFDQDFVDQFNLEVESPFVRSALNQRRRSF